MDHDATWMLGLAPFFADIGYWIHYDWFELGGIVGELQTYIISVALLCAAVSHTQPGKTPFVSADYMFGIPLCFMAIALSVKILQMVDLWPYTGSGAWNSRRSTV